MSEREELDKVVNRLVAGLLEGEMQCFNKELESCLYDREWCRVHNINYSDPDVGLARAELCVEWCGVDLVREKSYGSC